MSSEKRRIDFDDETRFDDRTSRGRRAIMIAIAIEHRRIVGYLTQITGHSPPLRPVMSVIVIPYVNAKYETMVIRR